MSKYSDFVETVDVVVNKPAITTPVDGAIDFNSGISASSFSSVITFNGVQDYVEWQLSTDSNFINIIDSFTGASNFTSWSPSYGNNPLTKMYVRVRYGSDNHLSKWSDVISLTTADIYVETPIVTVSGGTSNVPLQPTFNTSAFTIINGTDTHVSTDWQVSTTADFSNIVFESLNDTVNLTSITLTSDLSTDTQYYLRAKFNGSTYSSAYGNEVFTTANQTASPTLSGPTSANEWTSATITIVDYDATFTYVVTVPFGGVSRTDDIITWTLDGVDVDTNYDISVTAEDTVSGLPASAPTTFTVQVLNVPAVADQTLLYNAGNIANELYKTAGTDTSSGVVTPTAYEDVIDSTKTSTTTEVFIDNKKVDVKVGDTFKSDTGEGFTVSVVNADGTTAFINQVKMIACGDNHTAVIKTDDTVWSVGRNNYGQLGDGTTTNSSTFVDSGISAKAISC
ncbi:MAG: hypothetical protein QM489_03990, partial [Candidatus Izemoplasma sp.]